MQRRKFNREFKIEAAKLVRERGVSVARASRDLDVHENVLRKWVKEFGADPVQAFPGHGQMIAPGTRPEQMCSTTSSGSTMRPGVIRRSATSAQLSSNVRWD